MLVEPLTILGLMLDTLGAFLLAVPGLPNRGIMGRVRQEIYNRFPRVCALQQGWDSFRNDGEVNGEANAKELYYAVIPESRRDEIIIQESDFSPVRVTRPELAQFAFQMEEKEGERTTEAIYDFGSPALAQTLIEYRVENRIEQHFFRLGVILFFIGFTIQLITAVFF
jgi:hypothetical protein